ncbi:MAG: PDDEXK nuclease domain-containing protein [Fibromonadaceae bacterium]|nr:PDDEXK nuclease domain-containing protein [Fibromonadaceae bacterium]
MSMYWEIGKYVSKKVKSNAWGKSVVNEFSDFIQKKYLGIKGFSAQNVWRMKQFYEAYKDNEKLSTLSREIGWSNNILILVGAKTNEAREFYLMLTAKNNYSARELERQMDSMLFERTMISNKKNKSLVAKNNALSVLRDNYTLEFLAIPSEHEELELRKAIVSNLKNFILEFGKDFSFVGEEYKLQVGNTDFFIDLLFFNRELSCLVAIELKTGKFMPKHLGQLEFYLEALDRDVKKPSENPSVGLILCATKDDTVVEYALNRSISPTLVADYKLHLPDKKILENKLRELRELAEGESQKGKKKPKSLKIKKK